MVEAPQVKNRINIYYQERTSRYYAEDLGNGILLKMVEIPGGTFLMGSPEDEEERSESEGPQHSVILKSVFMGMYPVTQAQWRAIAATTSDLNPDPARFKGDNRPVEQVSWEDAIEFCALLSAKTGRDYGLPTEAEWEYACRAGTKTPFHFGETLTTDLANYDGASESDGTYGRGTRGTNRAETTQVDTFPTNVFGLYDMHGNVWEWCADHWHDRYESKPDELKRNGNLPWLLEDGSDNADRSLRGGSWIDLPRGCRSAYRGYLPPGVRLSNFGFRVVSRAARTR